MAANKGGKSLIAATGSSYDGIFSEDMGMT
jgi:hypothetical protein